MNAESVHTRHCLIIRNGLQVVQTVELADKNLTIGRSLDCDINLNRYSVSRQHATMEIRQDGWYVIDTGSVNGVMVNGRRTQEARLATGDVIEIRPFAINYMGGDTGCDDSIQLAESGAVQTITRDFHDAGSVVKQRLEDLYALSRLVIRRKDNGSFWMDVHAALQRSLAADRCVLVAVNQETGFYRLAPQARPSDSKTPLGVSRTVLNQVINARQGMLIQHVASDERFAGAVSLIGSQAGSVMCVPLLVEGTCRAIFYADRRTANLPFAEDDLDFVITAVDLASAAVEIDELQDQARELSRVRGRIDAAREIQELLLPSPIPQPPWGQVAAINCPADQISGDIYDALIDNQGRLVVCIADVSGKGVPAAFSTTILLSAFRNCLDYMEDLGQIIQHINKTFDTQSSARCFATSVICRWSAGGDSVEIVNAGHHAPLWLDVSGKVKPFPEKVGIPLGVSPDWIGQVVKYDNQDNLLVLFSSDGVTEARNPDGREYGLSRLADRLGQLRNTDADAAIKNVLEDLKSFTAGAEFKDDVTLLVVKRNRSQNTDRCQDEFLGASRISRSASAITFRPSL